MKYISAVSKKEGLFTLKFIIVMFVFFIAFSIYKHSYVLKAFYLSLFLILFLFVNVPYQLKKTVYSIEMKEDKIIFQCYLGNPIEVDSHDVIFRKSPWRWLHNIKWNLWRLFCEHRQYIFTLEHNGQVYYIGNKQAKDIELREMLATINIPVL
ncbi:hypothetical protein IOC51_23730 [Vibrio parahaemolyticus]|uniref:hypothetical protein n=1 Tax=Vibrio parahaemolyticus TaxID=670 RepID=UPI001E560453|nr:hypothetical protein [Vibrio parahaemolyticus]MCD1417035.1 hypothetical protein [Vibrio parahaemolyticus]